MMALKQNPAYEWLFLIFFLTCCCGCATINPGLKDFLEYQVAKQIVAVGKREAKKDYKKGLTLKQYEDRIKGLKINSPKGNLIETDLFIITKKAKIRLPKRIEEEINSDVNKIIGFKKEKIHLGLSVSINRVLLRADYNRWEMRFKQYYDGRWKFWFGYEIKF